MCGEVEVHLKLLPGSTGHKGGGTPKQVGVIQNRQWKCLFPIIHDIRQVSSMYVIKTNLMNKSSINEPSKGKCQEQDKAVLAIPVIVWKWSECKKSHSWALFSLVVHTSQSPEGNIQHSCRHIWPTAVLHAHCYTTEVRRYRWGQFWPV